MEKMTNFHEDLERHSPQNGSDRAFGLLFSALSAAIALWPLRAGLPVRLPFLLLTAGLLAVSLGRPSLLGPLNRIWTRVGMLLGRVVNPVVTALLFFLVFTPVGMLARFLGKDPLRLKWKPEADTYWITRDRADDPRERLAKQF